MFRAAARVLLLAVLFMSGCAQQPVSPTSPPQEASYWRGRLALRFDSPDQASFFASFELSGSASSGELNLTGPLGTTVASLHWTPAGASLRSNGDTRQFASLDALAAEATGTPIPVAALFQWLRGRETTAAGWQADLSQLAEGRLTARRTHPEPVAELRLILDP
jgi:outer membrane lipoprotein LolB